MKQSILSFVAIALSVTAIMISVKKDDTDEDLLKQIDQRFLDAQVSRNNHLETHSDAIGKLIDEVEALKKSQSNVASQN